jgi:hypothetical protein
VGDVALPVRRHQFTELSAENSAPYKLSKSKLSHFERLPFEVREQIYGYLGLPLLGHAYCDTWNASKGDTDSHLRFSWDSWRTGYEGMLIVIGIRPKRQCFQQAGYTRDVVLSERLPYSRVAPTIENDRALEQRTLVRGATAGHLAFYLPALLCVPR